ncbi:hypothetical protein [Aerococcus christensenii]|uniref:Uncharacterized protein n=1 Tax=Aerococcus christensenii TaxID=87541 RepID=A0A133XYR9_9LACT|nr:hypothetical protein [Aerococcus christensenii]KXB36088.1 hypothetical protein HMPREF3187_01107 [Aerococcus christensenii]MDK8234652.1 hypothetical protein [Aerococcus christensenii]
MPEPENNLYTYLKTAFSEREWAYSYELTFNPKGAFIQWHGYIPLDSRSEDNQEVVKLSYGYITFIFAEKKSPWMPENTYVILPQKGKRGFEVSYVEAVLDQIHYQVNRAYFQVREKARGRGKLTEVKLSDADIQASLVNIKTANRFDDRELRIEE